MTSLDCGQLLLQTRTAHSRISSGKPLNLNMPKDDRSTFTPVLALDFAAKEPNTSSSTEQPR